jgi:3-(3-hydroxy-phenyl)propionate hydroxylase
VVSELAVPIYRSREVTYFAQDDTGVTIELSDGASLRASYLVGCDGGRSLVRKAAGIEFRGWDAPTSRILAEAEMAEEPPLGIHRTAVGIHAFGREVYEIRDGKIVFANEGPINVMVTEKNVGATTEPTLRDLSEALVAVCGTDYGIHNLTWISRFTDMSRQAAAYRKGRVLLAGDAAHVHSPVGGQGLNTGVQDAIKVVYAKYDGPWELPALGLVSAPTAVLIRPDGYVAWVGDRTQSDLTDALTTWFGPPAAV